MGVDGEEEEEEARGWGGGDVWSSLVPTSRTWVLMVRRQGGGKQLGYSPCGFVVFASLSIALKTRRMSI